MIGSDLRRFREHVLFDDCSSEKIRHRPATTSPEWKKNTKKKKMSVLRLFGLNETKTNGSTTKREKKNWPEKKKY